MVNAVDPSGMITNAISLFMNGNSLEIASALSSGSCDNPPINASGICRNRCSQYQGSYSYVSCVVNCESHLIEDLRNSISGSAIESTILNSTVTLATISIQPSSGCNSLFDVINDKANGTSNCFSGNSSLGTVTAQGILTHDHFFDKAGNASIDNRNGLNQIKVFDWLYIEGSSGFHAFVPVETLTADYSDGTMLIKLPINVARFGKASSKAPFNLSYGDPVYFAYYPGNNAELGHYPSQSQIRVGVDAYTNFINSHRFLLKGLSTSLGDSGGGHFNARGELIGVLWGQEQNLHFQGVPILEGLDYYEPLRQSVAKVG